MLFDTHCHLHFEDFNKDREQVIQRAIQNEISSIITIGTDLESSKQAVSLAEKFVTVYAAVGIHPNDSKDIDESVLNEIKKLAANEKVVAIGEIGLDYYRMNSTKEKQNSIFRSQIQMARKLDLPIIVHNREAHEDLDKILVEEKATEVSGVLHAFSGDENFLNSILEHNFYISFTGTVTFKNANSIDLIKNVPLENLLLETDSPFLTPVPFRGKRNEPSYLTYTAKKIAQIKNISLEELAEITTANAKNIFRIKE